MKRTWIYWVVGAVALGGITVVGARLRQERKMVSSGRALSPEGEHVDVGSFPCNMVASHDGKYLVVTDAGFREQLTVIETATGRVADKMDFNSGSRRNKEGLYYGVVFGANDTLYVSRGTEAGVSKYQLDGGGKLHKLEGTYAVDASLISGPVSGVAYDTTHGQVFAAVNGADTTKDHHGRVVVFNAESGAMVYDVAVPGYPLDMLAIGGKVFVSCERDGVVVALKDGVAGTPIKTGSNPTKLTASPDQKSIYVTNSGSDTVSEIDVATETLKRTILLRPSNMRSLPISTPLGVAFNGKQMFVACGDLNAVAQVDMASGRLQGLIPTGWYPSAISAQSGSLYVASAKGVEPVHPTDKPNGPGGAWGKYPPNIIEGTVSKIALDFIQPRLKLLTSEVMENDRLNRKPLAVKNPGITHVIYVIKENRTYDQVFGDIKKGNGDPSLVMFGADVTPNEHALADRFTLLDNFYDCAEISADGWNWSTSGMVSEYTARNVVNNYSGRRKGYDYEGGNGTIAPDLEGIGDVATAPGGYLWDDAAKHGVSFRNYGFFVRGMKRAKGLPAQFEGVKKVLQGKTDINFPEFDLAMADSPLWQKINKTAEGQVRAIGDFKEPSRYDEWKREFDGYVKDGNMPALQLIRLPRDHTAGTSPGQWSPRAMVADNDYAVGKLVEAVSHSPYWKNTMICVLEDDAQNGFDHVDCHRSTALVISPYMERSRVDSRFYNTDSMLRTMEVMLGLPPMNGFDATCDPIGGFNPKAGNDEPFDAIMPSEKIAGEINESDAYRSADSKRLIALTHEESLADLQLNDILWGSIMGNRPRPIIHGVVTVDKDGDGDGD